MGATYCLRLDTVCRCAYKSVPAGRMPSHCGKSRCQDNQHLSELYYYWKEAGVAPVLTTWHLYYTNYSWPLTLASILPRYCGIIISFMSSYLVGSTYKKSMNAAMPKGARILQWVNGQRPRNWSIEVRIRGTYFGLRTTQQFILCLILLFM